MKTMSLRLIGLLVGASALMMALSGCGGSDGPPPDADPKGYYDVTGTATVDNGMGGTTSITDLQAIVYNNRVMMMSVDQGLLYDGTITSIDANDFTADVTIYTDGQGPMSATVSGTINEGSSITGTLTGTGAGSGSFDLLYASTNNQEAALSRVENDNNSAGSVLWSAVVGGGTSQYFFTIDATGNILDNFNNDGGIFDLCEINNGSISPISGTNLYQVNVEFVTCANVDVAMNYTGFATTQNQSDTTLVLMITSGNYGFYGDFR